MAARDNKRIIERHAKAIAKACKEYIRAFSQKHHLEGDYATSNAVLTPYYGIDRVIEEQCDDTLLGYNDYLIVHRKEDSWSYEVLAASFERAQAKARQLRERRGGSTFIALILEEKTAEPEANEETEEEG